MKSLCIKTNNSKLISYLLNKFKTLDIDKVYFSLKTFKYYKNIIIHYLGNDYENFIIRISNILSFLVIDELEEDLLKRLIYHNYFYFDKKERQLILENCFSIMAEDFSNLFNKKLELLQNNFLSFIFANKSIVLEGVINFRINSYMDCLNDIVETSVNSYIVEKEYLEFISLLKLYINSQKNTPSTIHIIYNDSNSILLDENNSRINLKDYSFKAKYLSDICFSNNDYILNYLLTLLPSTIYIHLTTNTADEFINTLQLIFEDRIKICTSCNICRSYSLESQITKKT